MLVPRIISNFDELSGIAPLWRELLLDSAMPEPMRTPSWLCAWWRVFGERDGRSLRAISLTGPDGQLVALVPLLRRAVWHRGLLPFRRVELLGSGEQRQDEVFSEYLGPIVRRGQEAVAAQALVRALLSSAFGAWEELAFSRLCAEDPFVPVLGGALAAAGIEARTQHVGEAPCLVLPATWDEYLRSLDGPRRYYARRALRELDAWAGADGWRLRHASTPAELEQGRAILAALHDDRWGGEGVFRSPEFSRFHAGVCQQLLGGDAELGDGALDLSWLEVKGEPVAAVYNIVYRGRIYFYQSGRLLDVPKAVRPGIALHLLAIQRAIRQGGIREYDFLSPANDYKRKLAPVASRSVLDLLAQAPTARAHALAAARRAGEAVIRRVKSPWQSLGEGGA